MCAIAIVLIGLPLLWYGPIVAYSGMANVSIQFALHSGELRVTAINTPELRRRVSVGDIAVPLFSGNDLLGIAFYGRHRNGTAIDPEERDLLTRLCDAAAVAYEAVALAQAREELAALRGMPSGA